ncbi:hypothetical protein HPB50_007681 [Hyalomma asiaticum]|uniref:Uncharacterized protein n=1 Tax=Hyalomma asiaticum TaxID=266040 RepID=A0ACB7TDW5_HYAAI|nr:hypothetical protein HPB50_007681 [Hyalomma asiaticum]
MTTLGLAFNTAKSAVLRFSGSSDNSPNVMLPKGDLISQAAQYRYLGVLLTTEGDLLEAHEKHLKTASTHEFKGYFKPKSSEVQEPLFPNEVDILVVGGGIMGSSIAYWLKQRAPESFTLGVLERDLTYARSSTVLSIGGIRQQFSLPENVQLSMFSAEFLRNVKQNLSVLDFDPPDIQFQPHGYLFLASEKGAEQMLKNAEMQQELGAKIELLKPDELRQQFPWINTDGIALASHARGPASHNGHCHGVGGSGRHCPRYECPGSRLPDEDYAKSAITCKHRLLLIDVRLKISIVCHYAKGKLSGKQKEEAAACS